MKLERASFERAALSLLKYMLTGGTAAVVDLALFIALHHLLGRIWLAATVSFCGAAMVNYILTSKVVFHHELSIAMMLSFFRYALAGAAVNILVTTICAELIHFPSALAKISGIGFAFIVNFIFNYFLVFRRPLQSA